mgnify:CR=1 FL=1
MPVASISRSAVASANRPMAAIRSPFTATSAPPPIAPEPVADAIRRSTELSATLSVRATEEACIYLKHPLFESSQRKMLKEVLSVLGGTLICQKDAFRIWAMICIAHSALLFCYWLLRALRFAKSMAYQKPMRA